MDSKIKANLAIGAASAIAFAGSVVGYEVVQDRAHDRAKECFKIESPRMAERCVDETGIGSRVGIALLGTAALTGIIGTGRNIYIRARDINTPSHVDL